MSLTYTENKTLTKNQLRKKQSHYSHYYTNYEPEKRIKNIPSELIGWDTEYLLPHNDLSQSPVTTALAFHVTKKPKLFDSLFPVAKKGVTEIYKGSDLGIPYLLYAYVTPLKIFSKVHISHSGYIIGFTLDNSDTEAGEDYQWFLNATFNNIWLHTGIHPKGKDESNPKLITTYSEAELGCLIPTLPTEKKFRELVNNLDTDTKLLSLQGSTIISDYPIIYSGSVENKLDILDTRHQGGNSVKGIGKTVGIDKVEGFDFSKHDASYYLEYNTLDFCYYNYIDALISLGSELFIHTALLDVINILEDKGLIDGIWYQSKKKTITTRDKASRKRTSSGIGEIIAYGMMKKEGKDKQFKTNANNISEKIHPNDRKVGGGLNQRTTGNISPEFYDNLNTWDFSSHYPHCMIALGKFPIYEPVGLGYMKTTAQALYNQLSYLDWYKLRASFTYPENTPLLKRLLLQTYNGTSINPEQVESINLTPPLLAIIAQITPDLSITVEQGWQWNPEFLEDSLKQGDNADNYYIDFSLLMIELLNLRNKYKSEGNHLMEQAVKLIGNSIYGKFAQDKDVFDPESLDLTITQGGEISSVANKKRCNSEITHPIYADAITSLGRAVTWWVAYKNDAVLTVTDSIAVTHDDDVNLQDYLIGDKFIDAYLNHSSIKLETPNPTMGLITGVRGRFLMDYNEMIANHIKGVDNTSWEEIEDIITDYADKKRQEDEKPQKVAKDGFKYEGDEWEQWKKSTLDHLKRYAGYPIEHKQTHLTKRNEVQQGKAYSVNFNDEKYSTKDCTEPRSGIYRTYDDYLAMKRTYDKVKRDNKKNGKDGKYQGLTAGQIHRFHPEWFEAEIKKSKSRSRPSNSIPIEIQRTIAIFCKLKLISQKTFADLLGIKQQSISHWISKLEKGLTTDYWGKQLIAEYDKIKETYNNCAEGVLQFSQKVDLGDEVTSKRANNSIGKALKTVEQYFGVSFGLKSKRAKKLAPIQEKVA